MNKSLILLFFIFVISLTISQACPDSQIIMRLSSQNNAHGALWNDNNYNHKICFNDIFGTNFEGLNPQQCTESNKILGLYRDSNSHAEKPESDIYQVNVCYGNLVCETRLDSCFPHERFIVSLYSETNSHISSQMKATSPYNICCRIACDNNVDNVLRTEKQFYLPGEDAYCYQGSSAEESNMGICRNGTRICQIDGTWNECFGQELPRQEGEICGSGQDESCTGYSDWDTQIWQNLHPRSFLKVDKEHELEFKRHFMLGKRGDEECKVKIISIKIGSLS